MIVKLNPTLLGPAGVAGIVHGHLGYNDVRLVPKAFEDDLHLERAISLIQELNQYAKDRGHRFGIKLTNTLVVDNHKQWMPDQTMYLSGPPLHVLATAVLDLLADALPGQLQIPGHDDGAHGGAGDIMVSFSAGIDKENLAAAIAMGVRPASVCSDLLKPGGYGQARTDAQGAHGSGQRRRSNRPRRVPLRAPRRRSGGGPSRHCCRTPCLRSR